jgi:hypothetical protein
MFRTLLMTDEASKASAPDDDPDRNGERSRALLVVKAITVPFGNAV